MKNIEEIRKEKYDRHNTKIVIISDWKELDKELYVITFQTFLSKHRNFLCCIEPL